MPTSGKGGQEKGWENLRAEGQEKGEYPDPLDPSGAPGPARTGDLRIRGQDPRASRPPDRTRFFEIVDYCFFRLWINSPDFGKFRKKFSQKYHTKDLRILLRTLIRSHIYLPSVPHFRASFPHLFPFLGRCFGRYFDLHPFHRAYILHASP